MERIKISVHLREKTGKEIAKKIRQKGSIPAIVYGQGANMPVEIGIDSLKILKKTQYSRSAIIDLELDSDKDNQSIPVLLKALQVNPLTDKVSHIDFLKISLESKIEVMVNIVLKGEPASIKEGAVLEQILRKLEIEALPLNIPQNIEVDTSELYVGSSIHAKDVKLPENIKLVTDGDETIVSLVAKTEEALPTEEEEALGAGEPEVIKEKKEGEEEGEVKEADTKTKKAESPGE